MDIHAAQIEKILFEYIGKNTLSDLNKIKPQTLLFKEGIFDSMGFILLVDFLEESFSFKINDNDLTEENFESITAITGLILRKKSVSVS